MTTKFLYPLFFMRTITVALPILLPWMNFWVKTGITSPQDARSMRALKSTPASCWWCSLSALCPIEILQNPPSIIRSWSLFPKPDTGYLRLYISLFNFENSYVILSYVECPATVPNGINTIFRHSYPILSAYVRNQLINNAPSPLGSCPFG